MLPERNFVSYDTPEDNDLKRAPATPPERGSPCPFTVWLNVEKEKTP